MFPLNLDQVARDRQAVILEDAARRRLLRQASDAARRPGHGGGPGTVANPTGPHPARPRSTGPLPAGLRRLAALAQALPAALAALVALPAQALPLRRTRRRAQRQPA